MIATVCAWHEKHNQAAVEVQRRLDGRQQMVVAAPALVEAYSVLTRLPPPHRLSANDALTLLETNFIKGAKIVALDDKSYASLLTQAPDAGIIGGRIYDAVIAMCAIKAKARALLTLNPANFTFAQKQIDVLVPGAS
jgi:predicted nucleic acid-binding protein